MKNKVQFVLVTCLFMLVYQLAVAQLSNFNTELPNSFEKYLGTTQNPQTRGATDALVYIDYEIQDGKVLAALTSLGYSYVVATDWTDFNTKLSYPDYKLAVMFNQNHSIGANLTTVTNFISAGGSMVYSDWTHTASFATLFQATFTQVDNQTEMTLSSNIATDLTNPLTLVNTGWGIFSTGLTATGGAEVLATFPNGDAAIVRGNSGRTIVLGYLSDTPPEAYRQQLFENLFISVTTPTGPNDPTSISATSNPICNGTPTQLTANGAQGTVYWYTGSCGGTATSPATGNSITVSPSVTTTYYARNYDNSLFSTGCASITITVEQTAISGSFAKTPNSLNVCQGTNVSAILTAGSGGNGNDETEYRTYAGTWSSWATYASGTNIATTGKTAVEIRTRRLATYCSASAYTTVSWTVEVTPIAGTLAKNPDLTNVCKGADVKAILTAGSGGNGSDETQFRTNDGSSWSSWTTYTSNSDISTTGKTAVEIQTRRLADYCSASAYTTVSWNVYDQFSVGSIQTTGETICYGDDPSEIGSSIAASGGDENITYQWQSSTNEAFTSPVTINSNTSTYDPPANLTVTTWYRRLAKDNTCNTTFTPSAGMWKVTVNPITQYRSVKTGNWTDLSTWEQRADGTNWSAAQSYPGGMSSFCGIPQATIRHSHLVTLDQSAAFGNVAVQSGGVLVLGEYALDIATTHTLTVETGGILHLRGETGLVKGAGDFVLQSGSTIFIGSDLGISKTKNEGNVINTGMRHFDGGATYIYNGTQNQVPGDGLPLEIENLIVNNPEGVTLNDDYQVDGTLNLLDGIIFTNGNVLIIVNDNPNAVTGGSQESYVRGTLLRFIREQGGSYSFPVGNNPYTPVTIDIDAGSDPGSLTVSTTATDHPQILSSQLNATQSVNRFWNIEVVSGLVNVNYDATFNWITGDEDGSFDETKSFIGKYNSDWTYPQMGARTATSTQIINQTSFSDFQVANGQSIEFAPCPSNISIINDEGLCSAVVTYVATISTTLSVDDYSLSYAFTGATMAGGAGTGSGAAFNVGITNVTITAISNFETIECSFTIQVTDNEKPAILNIPSNITVNNEAGVCSSRVSWTPPTTTDNCSIASLVSNFTPNSRFAVGVTTVTYTATDVNGNSHSASFTVTVIDNEKPRVVGMPIDLFRVSDPGTCEKSVSWQEPIAKDNCGVASVSSTHDSGDIFEVGETTVTYTITDIHGNEITKSFVVKVIDCERPKIESIEMILPAP